MVEIAEATKLAGAVGACVSQIGVMVLAELLAAERFPAASLAFTVNE